ncbi:hypothetical protein RFI_36386, partial [Reticulomyxa filosa]
IKHNYSQIKYWKATARSKTIEAVCRVEANQLVGNQGDNDSILEKKLLEMTIEKFNHTLEQRKKYVANGPQGRNSKPDRSIKDDIDQHIKTKSSKISNRVVSECMNLATWTKDKDLDQKSNFLARMGYWKRDLKQNLNRPHCNQAEDSNVDALALTEIVSERHTSKQTVKLAETHTFTPKDMSNLSLTKEIIQIDINTKTPDPRTSIQLQAITETRVNTLDDSLHHLSLDLSTNMPILHPKNIQALIKTISILPLDAAISICKSRSDINKNSQDSITHLNELEANQEASSIEQNERKYNQEDQDNPDDIQSNSPSSNDTFEYNNKMIQQPADLSGIDEEKEAALDGAFEKDDSTMWITTIIQQFQMPKAKMKRPIKLNGQIISILMAVTWYSRHKLGIMLALSHNNTSKLRKAWYVLAVCQGIIRSQHPQTEIKIDFSAPEEMDDLAQWTWPKLEEIFARIPKAARNHFASISKHNNMEALAKWMVMIRTILWAPESEGEKTHNNTTKVIMNRIKMWIEQAFGCLRKYFLL